MSNEAEESTEVEDEESPPVPDSEKRKGSVIISGLFKTSKTKEEDSGRSPGRFRLRKGDKQRTRRASMLRRTDGREDRLNRLIEKQDLENAMLRKSFARMGTSGVDSYTEDILKRADEESYYMKLREEVQAEFGAGKNMPAKISQINELYKVSSHSESSCWDIFTHSTVHSWFSFNTQGSCDRDEIFSS